MEAIELRIGNWYDDNGVARQVTPSVIQEVFEAQRTWCEPIKLTEKWIENFGFVFRNTNKQYGWYLEVSKNRVLTWCHSKEVSLDFDLEDYDYNNTLFDFHCQFVHQLQNIYFMLTNKDLIIN
jgi:hypothetical protein